jgi:pimeloyl-ACP methyl ester carboxylesterase
MIHKVVKHGEQHPEFVLRDSEIEQLQIPVLWLWGKNDSFAGSEIAMRIHGKVKHSKLVEFNLAGHLPWLDHPEEHAAQIRNFIAEKRKGRTAGKEAIQSTAQIKTTFSA